MSQGGSSLSPPGEGSPPSLRYVWVVLGGLEYLPPVGLGGWFCPTPFGSWFGEGSEPGTGGFIQTNIVYLFLFLLVGLRTSVVAHPTH